MDRLWSWTSEQLRPRPESLLVACLTKESSSAYQFLEANKLAKARCAFPVYGFHASKCVNVPEDTRG